MIVEAFRDTSVLVPLCVEQVPHTDMSRKLLRRYAVNVWWGTAVEIISALTRLRRSGMVTEPEYLRAKAELTRMLIDWNMIAPSDGIKIQAVQFLEKYPLRAADAFQLAAATEWCDGQPNGQVFLTADRRLAEAAGLVGFTLEPGLAPLSPTP